jgi:hypothetical protein
MDQRWLRIVAAIGAFILITGIAVAVFGRFPEDEPDPLTFAIQSVANILALILAVAALVALVVYLGLEWIQTGSLGTVSRQFGTRTLVLMPIAIGLNIVLGQTVVATLKIPIYLDSVGTILVGVLAGPLAGAATGFLANLLWAYVIPAPFQYPPAAAFAIVAAVIGLLAGIAARLDWMRPRPDRSLGQLILGGAVAAALVVGLAVLAYVGYAYIYEVSAPTLEPSPAAPIYDNPVFLVLGWLAIALVALTVLGLFALLIVRRDLTASFVVIAGVVTGIVAALISAPIAAGVFGGVTGAGTDFLVAAFRQAGLDIQAATLGQGLISDPIDKVTTFLIVYLIVSAMARRMKARFPQGERLVADEPPEAPA